MRTPNTHWTRRNVACSCLVAFACAALALGCGDDTPSDGDAAVDLDAGADAFVDPGPPDCGVDPLDGGVCNIGRLYNFETEEPVVNVDPQPIYAFGYYTTELMDQKNSSDEPELHVNTGGWFHFWDISPNNDTCVALDHSVPGFNPGEVNCYASERDGVDHLRYYLLPETLVSAWEESYPGNDVDLATYRPFFVGLCLNTDYSRYTQGSFQYWFTGQQDHLNGVRTGSYGLDANDKGLFVEPFINGMGNIPDSGELLIYAIPGINAAPLSRLDFGDFGFGPVSSDVYYFGFIDVRMEHVTSGDIEFLFIHTFATD